MLKGHRGNVNCLLYPHGEHERYDASLLLSGGADFTVVMWDLNSGRKLFTFCNQGGEISQLLVPPPTCNVRSATSMGSCSEFV